MSVRRILTALCITALAGACGALSPLSIVEAARLDPLNTPPEELVYAVSVPDAIVLNDGDAVVRMALSADGETLVDSIVPHSPERAPNVLHDRATQGDTVYAATLSQQRKPRSGHWVRREPRARVGFQSL